MEFEQWRLLLWRLHRDLLPGDGGVIARRDDNRVKSALLLQAATSASSCGRTRSRTSGQDHNASRPFMSSTSAVQLSTQSPSLQYCTPSMSRISARWMWPQTTPSTPRLRAACATACSKLAMYCTAVLALCLR